MFDNVTNKDDKRRMEIFETYGATIDKKWYLNDNEYDILKYYGLTAEALDTLIEEHFADENERQNSAPTIGTIRKFLHAHPSFTAHGYIVTPNREDYRVSIEGVESDKSTPEEIKAFTKIFHRADDFVIGGDGSCYCWYD